MDSRVPSGIPAETIDWLTGSDNPAVAVLTRTTVLAPAEASEFAAVWRGRNEYASVAEVLEAMRDDGSWSSTGRPAGSIACLTANVGRGLARLGYERDAGTCELRDACVARLREPGWKRFGFTLRALQVLAWADGAKRETRA